MGDAAFRLRCVRTCVRHGACGIPTQEGALDAVQYHADQNLDELRGFWGKSLGIDGSVIKLLRKSNSNQLTGRTWRSRHGVLSIRVQDTSLRARMQTWIDRLRDEWQ
jgi:hypothetical protein